MLRTTLAALVFIIAIPAFAQYNEAAGVNAPMVSSDVQVYDQKTRKMVTKTVRAPAKKDKHGNANGSQFDLAVDGAFEGQTVAVLHFYTGEGFDFSLPKAALAQKGFSVYRWLNAPPSPRVLRNKLKKASQLWLISSSARLLSEKHLDVIEDFFESGRGVYIWGDNEPYYADANAVAERLFGATMTGNLMGDQVVGLQMKRGTPGVLPNHLVTTGIEQIYEGVTIATLAPHQDFKPMIYGSAGNLVTALYERNGRRAILDGGFTRLFIKWDTAGTARYVKNAAAWLANIERFGETVVSAKMP